MRSLIFLLLISFTAQAQPPSKPLAKLASENPDEPAKPKWFVPNPNPIEPKDGKLTIPLTLTPTAVKKPLSKYYLTPQYSEMKPGNRIPTFMRAYMEQENFYSKVPRENRELFNQMRLEDLPLQEMRNSGCINGLAYRDTNSPFANRGRPLGDVDEGARQLSSDWQIWFNLREDGIGTLLPEVQKMREHASCLKVRMRYEIRTGDIEKAIYTARTFNGLATSFESHPTLIGHLVSIAIQSICLEALEELIQQPTCPNLYWSFTEIPSHVLDPRLGIQGERIISGALFQPFLDATGPMSDEDVYKHLKAIESIEGFGNGIGNKPMRYSLDAGIRSTDKKKLVASKKLLIELGAKPAAVDKFTDLQLIVTADIRRYEIILDEMLIASSLPHPQAVKHADEIFKTKLAEQGLRLAQMFVPANRGIITAHAHIRQRVAYLRILEAIRLYAFEHEGQLPAKLADCSVPLPLDPVTEKPFEYSVKDGVATLHGGNFGPNEPSSNRHYEIRIKK